MYANPLDRRDRTKAFLGARSFRGHDDGALGAMPPHELCRSADVDDPAVVEDCDAVAEPLGLLHEVRRQEDRLAAVPDAADQVPDCPPRLRVESRRQFIEENELGVVDERERDEQPVASGLPRAS